MNKQETIKMVNEKIDKMIVEGKDNTPEYKRLTTLHYKLTH